MASTMFVTSLLLVCVQVTMVTGFLVVQRGECPPVQPMPNFDINRYMGKWYAMETFPAPYQVFSQCIAANYTLLSENQVRVFNDGYKVIRFWIWTWKEYSSADGFASIRNTSIPSALNVDFPGQGSSFFRERPGPNYIVVDTDYDNYVLIWSCIEFDLGGLIKLRADSAWIMSRDKTKRPANTEALKQKLRDYNIDTSFFRRVDHDFSFC